MTNLGIFCISGTCGFVFSISTNGFYGTGAMNCKDDSMEL